MSTLAMLSFFLGVCYLVCSYQVSKRIPYSAEGRSFILSTIGIIVRVGLVIGAVGSFMAGSYMLGVSSSHHPDIFRVLGAFTIFECCWIIMWSVLLEHDIGLAIEKWIRNQGEILFEKRNAREFFLFICLFFTMLLLVFLFSRVSSLFVILE